MITNKAVKKLKEDFNTQLNDALAKQKQELFTPENVLKMQYEIAAKEAIIDSQVGAAVDLIDPNHISWNQWINLNNWANYFANRWRFEAVQMHHTIAINLALRNGYIFGECGVWNNNGTPELVTIHRIGATTIEFTLLPRETKELEKMAAAGERWKGRAKGTLKAPKNQIIVYQFDSFGYGAIITLRPMLLMEDYIQRALFNEMRTIPARMIHDKLNNNSSNEVVRDFLELKKPIITRYRGGEESFEAIALNTNTANILELIEASKNWYYDILGRRTNSDFKLSHTLESEAKNSEANVIALEWDRYLFFKKFIQDYAKLFNLKDIKIENLNGQFTSCWDSINLTQEVDNDTQPTN